MNRVKHATFTLRKRVRCRYRCCFN